MDYFIKKKVLNDMISSGEVERFVLPDQQQHSCDLCSRC